MAKTLNAREKRFKELYLVSLNPEKAAVDAGYSVSTARCKAHSWVSISRDKCPNDKKHLWDAINDAKNAISETTGIDAEFIRTRLAEMINADPCDIINEETGAYKRIHDWPIEWRRMLSAADVRELFEANAQGKQEKIGEIVKFKFIDKLKAYELLGKHVGVQAFKDKIVHEGSIGITIDSEDSGL